MIRWLAIFGLVAALGALVALGGFLVSASGLIPIKASSGHFAITEWFLHFSMQRSIATHTIGDELSGLADPTLVLRGAGHYETGCRPCHGAPDLHAPRVARAMLPPPPYLPDEVVEWPPEELFYIVKHGIKFTGMPAWPAQQRDDEVRAVVAFLVKLPGMSAGQYRRLVDGEAQSDALAVAAPDAELAAAPGASDVVATCVRCHGREGHGRENAAFPKLAGQRAAYLSNALHAYAQDKRFSGMMQPIAAGLDDQEIARIADYYAALPVSSGAAAEVRQIALGRDIATRGIPAEQVPSCSDCHGPRPREKNEAYPVLAGQYAEYLVEQLELLKQGKRGGSRYVHLMHRVVSGLGSEQMRAVAAYYSSLR